MAEYIEKTEERIKSSYLYITVNDQDYIKLNTLSPPPKPSASISLSTYTPQYKICINKVNNLKIENANVLDLMKDLNV